MPFDGEIATQPKLPQPRASLPMARLRPTISPPPLADQAGARKIPPVVRPPLPRDLFVSATPHARIVPLQTWEGYVAHVDTAKGTFAARLSDLESDATGDEEFAELLISDVDPDDHELVRPGGVFRWIIGYRDQPFGKRERISSLIFRRLPAWRVADLMEAQEQGRQLAAAFQWD